MVTSDYDGYTYSDAEERVLRFYRVGWSYLKIGKRLGISPESARQIVRRRQRRDRAYRTLVETREISI